VERRQRSPRSWPRAETTRSFRLRPFFGQVNHAFAPKPQDRYYSLLGFDNSYMKIRCAVSGRYSGVRALPEVGQISHKCLCCTALSGWLATAHQTPAKTSRGCSSQRRSSTQYATCDTFRRRQAARHNAARRGVARREAVRCRAARRQAVHREAALCEALSSNP